MTKRLINLALIAIILSLIYGCSENPAVSENENEVLTQQNEPLFLLGLDGDPLGLEDEATGPEGSPFGGPFGGPNDRRPDPEGRPGGPAFAMDACGHLLAILDLTDEQKVQIKQIAESYREAFHALREEWQNGTSWEEIRQKRDELREAFLEEITPILTPEQQALLAEMRENIAKGNFPEQMIDRRLQMLTEILSLTAEQQDRIRDLLIAAGEKLITARESSENFEEFHQSVRAIFQELNEQIRALLTDEQLDIYEQLQEHLGRHRGNPPHRPFSG